MALDAGDRRQQLGKLQNNNSANFTDNNIVIIIRFKIKVRFYQKCDIREPCRYRVAGVARPEWTLFALVAQGKSRSRNARRDSLELEASQVLRRWPFVEERRTSARTRFIRWDFSLPSHEKTCGQNTCGLDGSR